MGVEALTAAIAGSNNTKALASITQTLASSMGRPASAFVATPGASPSLANAPFSLSAPVAPFSAGGDSSSTAGVGGGVGGGIVAALLVVWMFYSYQKHGAIPCCRNYAQERREKEAAAAAALEAREIREELEKAVATSNPLGGGADKSASAALVIRNMAQSNRKLKDQEEAMAKFKAQVAVTVQKEA